MKKILILLVFGIIAFSSCSDNNVKDLTTYEYLSKSNEPLKLIVNAENKKAPLAVQKYNSIKNNVKKIEFEDLKITTCNVTANGYFITKWTITSEYFSEETYEYLIECHNIKVTKDYVVWEVVWPQEHPFIDK